jgi:predicted RNase H-like HicB family nuclease
MLTEYIEAAMKQAMYKTIEDGTYFGDIPGFQGVWGNAKTLKECQIELREVLEEWLVLMLRDDQNVPAVDGIDLNRKPVKT